MASSYMYRVVKACQRHRAARQAKCGRTSMYCFWVGMTGVPIEHHRTEFNGGRTSSRKQISPPSSHTASSSLNAGDDQRSANHSPRVAGMLFLSESIVHRPSSYVKPVSLTARYPSEASPARHACPYAFCLWTQFSLYDPAGLPFLCYPWLPFHIGLRFITGGEGQPELHYVISQGGRKGTI